MPVVINKETGLAENLSPQEATQAAQSGSHDLPLVSPEGEVVNAPYEQAFSLVSQGYSQPNTEQLVHMLEHATYNSPREQAKTALEGAASAATLGASTGIERAIGVNPEDIRKRAEYNPGLRGAGQVVGLVGSALLMPEVGAAEAMGALGEAGSAALNLGTSFAGRVGTAAAKAGIENMVFQAGNEADKMFMGDPHQSIETAVTDVGLSGLLGAGLGGAFGATSELWNAGPGAKMSKVLDAIKARAAGVPEDVAKTAGIEIPADVAAGLSDNPYAQETFQRLQESSSAAGSKSQANLANFKTSLNDTVAAAVGKAPEDLDSLAHVSDYDIGKQTKGALENEFRQKFEPVSKAFDEFKEKFKAAELTPEIKSDIAQKITDMATEQGFAKSSEAQMNFVTKTLQNLSKQENANDLKNFMSNIAKENSFGKDTYQVAKDIRKILAEGQDQAISTHIGETAPELMADYQATRQEWGKIKGTIEDLKDRLHTGKDFGPESFLKNLKENITPEEFIKRVSPKGDVEMQQLLQQQFPETAQAVKDHELNKVLKASLSKDGAIDAAKFLKNINKLNPEMRKFVLPEGSEQQLAAVQELLSKIPAKLNPSGSAKTWSKLWGTTPENAISMGMLLHNPASFMSAIAAKLAGMGLREGPDAARLAMLKFLGSETATNSASFAAGIKMASAVLKGETALNKAANAVFTGARGVVSEPSQKDRDKLKKQVDDVQADPDILMRMGGDVGHYMPDHASAASELAARNLQYLASLKPNLDPQAPLDEKREASAVQTAEYNRALDIAQNPLILMNDVQQGSVTMKDLQHLQKMYPALYPKMVNKLNEQLINHKAKDKVLPYKTKLGLSTFMGQPLDSSMLPNNIMSAQFGTMPKQQLPVQAPRLKNANKLDKLSNSYLTPGQSREKSRANRH